MAGFLIGYFDAVDLTHEELNALYHTGTPIIAFEIVENGYLIPGYFDFVFSNVTPGVEGDVQVIPPSENYSRLAQTFTDVPFDGSWVYDIVPGTRIKFSASGSFSTAWKTRIYFGAHLGRFTAGNPSGVTLDQEAGFDPTNLTTGHGPGAIAAIEIWKITNLTGKTALETWAKLLPVVAPVIVSPPGLLYVGNSGKNCVEKHNNDAEGKILAYSLVCTSVTTGVTPHEIGFTVDGDFVDDGILDTDNNDVNGSIGGIRVGKKQVFTQGDLEGVELTWPTDTVVGSATDLYVVAPRWNEISPDNGSGVATTRRNDGVEDGTLWADSEVGLTPIGGTVGQMVNGESGLLHRKSTIPRGAAFGANRRSPKAS